MLRTRVIPVLLLRGESLVKTRQFGKFEYIGDPCNTVRIFNELEVDELAFLDITATIERREPNFDLLRDIASECFMPLSYGGGISSLEQASRIFTIGFEKVIINSANARDPLLLTRIAEIHGTQAVVASIDIRRNVWGNARILIDSGTKRHAVHSVEWAQQLEAMGAGEILLTSVNKEGMWTGLDIEMIRQISDAVSIPVIAHGGAGCVEDIAEAVHVGGASSVAVGSMVVFQKKGFGVLVNFPDKLELEKALSR